MATPKAQTFITLTLAFAAALFAKPNTGVEGISKTLKSHELGSLIQLLMPPKDFATINWDWQVNGQIEWVTNGVDIVNNADGSLTSSRLGRVRVNVLGETSTVLKKSVKELAWAVVFETNGPTKFGVERILIFPGSTSVECFGSLYTNCDFEIEPSLKLAKLKFTKLCSKKDAGSSVNVYRIRNPNLKEAILIHETGWGSAGISSQITIDFTDDDVCNGSDE